VRREAARAGGDDFIADFELFYLFADGGDAPGTFIAEQQINVAFHRINAERLHHIAKIQGRRANLIFNFMRAGLAARRFEQGQFVHHAGRGDFQAVTGIARQRRARRMQFQRSPHEPVREPGFVAPCDFCFAIAKNDFLEQVACIFLRIAGIQINQPAGKFRKFGRDCPA
jgi:hypothetical protein